MGPTLHTIEIGTKKCDYWKSVMSRKALQKPQSNQGETYEAGKF